MYEYPNRLAEAGQFLRSLAARAQVAVAMTVALMAFAGGAASPAAAQTFDTKVAQAILIDVDTQTVLFQKNADAQIPPASLAKLMTMAVIFDALKKGRLKLEDGIPITVNAWKKGGAGSGGSTMFAAVNTTIRVQDLMRGVIVQSGNDAAIALAEGLAGSEEAFADLMNEEAQKIGLKNSVFRNSTGLPDPAQHVSVRDLAKLAEYIIRNFPEYYAIYGERDFTWNKIKQSNRNPLLDANMGADGMKTGYTEESGYALVGSAVRDGRRVIAVISGATTDKERAEESRKIIDWGFRAFRKVPLFDAGETVAEAQVFGGDKPKLKLVSKQPISAMLPTGSLNKVAAKVSYTGPVAAPIAEGQEIGKLRISVAGEVTSETPLFAGEAIGRGALRARALDAVEQLLVGWW